MVIDRKALGISTAEGPRLIGTRGPARTAKRGRFVLSYLNGRLEDRYPWVESGSRAYPSMFAELGQSELMVWPFVRREGARLGASWEDWNAPEFDPEFEFGRFFFPDPRDEGLFDFRYRVSGIDSRPITGKLRGFETIAELNLDGIDPQWQSGQPRHQVDQQEGRLLTLEIQGKFRKNGTRTIEGQNNVGGDGYEYEWMTGTPVIEHYIPTGQLLQQLIDLAEAGAQPDLPVRLAILSPVQVEVRYKSDEKNENGEPIEKKINVTERIYPTFYAATNWEDTSADLWQVTVEDETWGNADYNRDPELDPYEIDEPRRRGFIGVTYEPLDPELDHDLPPYLPTRENPFPNYPVRVPFQLSMVAEEGTFPTEQQVVEAYWGGGQVYLGGTRQGWPIMDTPIGTLLTSLPGVLPKPTPRKPLVMEAELPGAGAVRVNAPDDSLTSGDHPDHLVGGASISPGGSGVSSWAILRRPKRSGVVETNLLTLGNGNLRVYRTAGEREVTDDKGVRTRVPRPAGPQDVNLSILIRAWLADQGRPAGEDEAIETRWLESNLLVRNHPDHVRVIGGGRAWIINAWDPFRDGTPDQWDGSRPRTLELYRELKPEELPLGPDHGLAVVGEVPAPTPDSAGLPRYGVDPGLIPYTAGPSNWPWGTVRMTDRTDQRDTGTDPLVSPITPPETWPSEEPGDLLPQPVVLVGRMRGDSDPEPGDPWTWSEEPDRRQRWRPFVAFYPEGLPVPQDDEGVPQYGVAAPLEFPGEIEHIAAYTVGNGGELDEGGGGDGGGGDGGIEF